MRARVCARVSVCLSLCWPAPAAASTARLRAATSPSPTPSHTPTASLKRAPLGGTPAPTKDTDAAKKRNRAASKGVAPPEPEHRRGDHRARDRGEHRPGGLGGQPHLLRISAQLSVTLSHRATSPTRRPRARRLRARSGEGAGKCHGEGGRGGSEAGTGRTAHGHCPRRPVGVFPQRSCRTRHPSSAAAASDANLVRRCQNRRQHR